MIQNNQIEISIKPSRKKEMFSFFSSFNPMGNILSANLAKSKKIGKQNLEKTTFKNKNT